MMVLTTNIKGQTHDNWTHVKERFSSEETDNDRGVRIHIPVGLAGSQWRNKLFCGFVVIGPKKVGVIRFGTLIYILNNIFY